MVGTWLNAFWGILSASGYYAQRNPCFIDRSNGSACVTPTNMYEISFRSPPRRDRPLLASLQHYSLTFRPCHKPHKNSSPHRSLFEEPARAEIAKRHCFAVRQKILRRGIQVGNRPMKYCGQALAGEFRVCRGLVPADTRHRKVILALRIVSGLPRRGSRSSC
jgi:hypothetical protein